MFGMREESQSFEHEAQSFETDTIRKNQNGGQEYPNMASSKRPFLVTIRSSVSNPTSRFFLSLFLGFEYPI